MIAVEAPELRSISSEFSEGSENEEKFVEASEFCRFRLKTRDCDIASSYTYSLTPL